jgi:hypothetical protein
MTTRGWMVAVAFFALAFYRVELAMLVVLVALAWFAVGCLVVRPVGSRAWRTAVSCLVTLVCLYSPYLWLVLMDGSWDQYRWFWIQLWPVMPGFILALVTGHHDETTIAAVLAPGALFLIALFTWLGSLGRPALIASGVAALIVSGLQSWVALACFLM